MTNAHTLPEEPSSPLKQRRASRFEDAHRALEIPIYDLTRLLRAAVHLQEEYDEDLCSSARLIVELAAQKADELNEQYQGSFPGEGRSQVEEGPSAKAFILQELDACERRLRETRMQAEAKRGEAAR
jgi:hypothetical protein